MKRTEKAKSGEKEGASRENRYSRPRTGPGSRNSIRLPAGSPMSGNLLQALRGRIFPDICFFALPDQGFHLLF